MAKMEKENKTGNKDIDIEDSRAPLISHLIELRDRLNGIVFFIAFVLLYFATDIYKFLVNPLAVSRKKVENPRMIYLNRNYILKVSFGAFLFLSYAFTNLQICTWII